MQPHPDTGIQRRGIAPVLTTPTMWVAKPIDRPKGHACDRRLVTGTGGRADLD